MRIISLFAAIAGAVIIAASFRAAAEPYSVVVGVVAVTLTAVSPQSAIALLLFLLPVFGNKPATAHCWYLTIIASGIAVGAELRRFAVREGTEDEGATLHSPISDATVFYLLVSVLSLSALPLGRGFGELGSALAAAQNWRQQISTAAYWIISLFHLPEDQPFYPFVSVLKTVLAFAVGLALRDVLSRSAAGGKKAVKFGSAIFAGIVAAVIAGLIQYYHPIGLERLRPLDPTANSGGIEFRLQSLFAHSGWFAEYLTLSIPFVLMLLLPRCSFGLRAAAIIISLMLGEFALILSYQRGGWISYPLTLLAVWGAIYVFRAAEKGGGELNFGTLFRRSLLKIAVSVPLTVILSLSIVWAVQHHSPQSSAAIDSYVERFKGIGKTSDRTEFIKAGAKLTSLHPLLGAGSESFAIEFEREFNRPGGAFYGQADLPLHGSAHNVFFQTAAGKGMAGLFLLLLVLTSILVDGVKSLNGAALSREQTALILSCVCFSAALLIYGNVQEVFYVYPLEILFFATAALAAAVVPADSKPNKLRPMCIAILTLGLVLHLVWELEVPGRTGERNRSESYGCYTEEKGEDGRIYRWCGPKTRVELPVVEEGGIRAAVFAVRVPLSVHSENRLRVLISGRYSIDQQITVGSESKFTIPLPADYPMGEDSVLAEIDATPLVIPARDLPGSRDFRLLSFQLVDS